PDLERSIAGVLEKLLGQSPIGTEDNFFDLGANSLLMMQANSNLRAALGRHLSLVDMFQYPTVKSLAAFLAEQDPGRAPAADPSLQQSQERGQSRRDALQRRRGARLGKG